LGFKNKAKISKLIFIYILFVNNNFPPTMSRRRREEDIDHSS
jgi:hypothetical protein